MNGTAVDLHTALVHMRKATDLHAIEETKTKVEEARSRHGDIPDCYAHIQSMVDKVCNELRKAREQLSDSRSELSNAAQLIKDPYYRERAKAVADENLDAMGSISYVLDRIPDFVWYSVFNQPTTTNQGETMISNAPDGIMPEQRTHCEDSVKASVSAPWYLYVRMVRALFGRDPAVSIEYIDTHKELTLYVNGEAKAEAIGLLLPTEKVFGSVVLKISVVPANKLGLTTSDIFNRAFAGNQAFKVAGTYKPDGCSNPFNFVVFDNKVVQLWADNLCDINGLVSTLYQDIAKEVLNTPPGTYYCTDMGSDVIRD